MNAIIEFTNQFLKNLLPANDKQDGVFEFNGGVHPPGHKSESTQHPIKTLAIPKKLVLPLRQHIGNLPKLVVDVGDYVKKGQLLAEAEGNVSAAIHAPTSGHINEISEQVIPHPSGLKDHCITLIPDGKDTWVDRQVTDWHKTDKATLVESLHHSGIVGLGGATFPTHIKAHTTGQRNIHTLVINAAECEPYITCDDMLMRERAEAVAKGIEIVKHLLNADKCVIGLEDNKPVAEAALQQFADQYGYSIHRVPTLYPSGDARRLIHLITGTEVPYNRRSTDIGIQVFNVATVVAIHRFFDYGEPAINRIITMTGAVKQPQNFEVLFGTPLSDLVSAAGGAHHDTTHFIMGGPMMGFNLPLEDVSLSKAANCIIAVTPSLFEAPPPAMPCIRCARCADACPVSLQPQELYWFSKSSQLEKARDYQLFDCIECGCCSYVCPSDIPLVQYYRFAKSEVIAADKAKEAADLARERNDFRLARIEREKEERARKHAERTQAAKAKKQAEANKETTANDAEKSLKQEAIAAAVARAKAKKSADSAAGIKPKNTENVSPSVAAEIESIDAAREKATSATSDEKQAKIQAAIAKAKAKKAAAQQSSEQAEADDATATDKQAKIQAAIAKAKANKAAADKSKEHSSQSSNNVEDEKQAKVQAALARARANKKAADAAKGKIQSEDNNTNTTAQNTDDDKQAKIQAAIAKAKANKAAADKSKEHSSQSSSNADDDKQAKVQAALARARANKKAADAAKTSNPTVSETPEGSKSNAPEIEVEQHKNNQPEANEPPPTNDKQAKIQAALAKARENKRKADAAKAAANKPENDH